MEFDLAFEPAYGQAVQLHPLVRRITVNNPSPFTFHGTNSYLIGTETLAVLDPGPDDDAHLDALMRAIGDRPVSHIVVTHTHRDHSPLAARLKAATGAQTVAEGPHRASRVVNESELAALDASGDLSFRPDIRVADGDVIAGHGWSLDTVLTPGHAANHAAFALAGTGILFSGDHVMGWSTSVVAPPDGSMTAYVASLDKLLARGDSLYLPGHGGPVTEPRAFVRALKAHRRMRERAILERVRLGDRTLAAMVDAIYRDLDPRLKAAAGLSVFAHLEDLVGRGLLRTDGPPALAGEYRPA